MSYIENIESSELSMFFDIVRNSNASLAKLVDASDLKSDILMVCRFESGYSHHSFEVLPERAESAYLLHYIKVPPDCYLPEIQELID